MQSQVKAKAKKGKDLRSQPQFEWVTSLMGLWGTMPRASNLTTHKTKGKTVHSSLKIHGHILQREDVWPWASHSLPKPGSSAMRWGASLGLSPALLWDNPPLSWWQWIVLRLHSREKWGRTLGHEFRVLPSLHPLALGSWDLPYVTWSGKRGQEGKNITPKLWPRQYHNGFWRWKKKMKGTRREVGRNRAHVKSRLIPLAWGIHLYLALCVTAGSTLGKEAVGVGWRGDTSITIVQSV